MQMKRAGVLRVETGGYGYLAHKTQRTLQWTKLVVGL